MNEPTNNCSGCGISLPQGARFCSACGTPAVAAALAPAPAENTDRSPDEAGTSPFACPQCRQSRHMEKVSELVKQLEAARSQPTASGREEGREDLIDQLALPEKPEQPAVLPWVLVALIPVLGPLLMLLAPMTPRWKGFQVGVVLSFLIALAMHLTNTTIEESGAFYFVGLFMMFSYWLALVMSRSRQREDYIRRVVPEWEAARSVWPSLHYCKRCKLVCVGAQEGVRSSPLDEAEIFLTDLAREKLAADKGSGAQTSKPGGAAVGFVLGLLLTMALGYAAFSTFHVEKPPELSDAEKEKLFKQVVDDLPANAQERPASDASAYDKPLLGKSATKDR